MRSYRLSVCLLTTLLLLLLLLLFPFRTVFLLAVHLLVDFIGKKETLSISLSALDLSVSAGYCVHSLKGAFLSFFLEFVSSGLSIESSSSSRSLSHCSSW